MHKIFAALCAVIVFIAIVAYVPVIYAHTPPIRPHEAPIPRLDPSRPAIALTFDDGPHPIYTDRILDCLDANGAKGTFFIIGEKINDSLPQINRILTGHQLGNHTWGHVDLTDQTAEGIWRQIYSVHDSVKGLFSVGPQLVRPPYGFSSIALRRQCQFPLIHWSVDTRDWESLDSGSVIDEIMAHVSDGDIILMHDIYPSTADAVEMVVPLLREQGYQMVTVSELFELKELELQAGRVYYKAE